MAKNSKNKGGAPYKVIDWDKVDQMLIQGCNGTQVAAVLGIHPETLYLRCESEKKVGFSAYYQEKRSKGDSFIHQEQYQKAVKEKNTTMLIWLGKQRCGQRDYDLETIKTSKEDADRVDVLMNQIKQLQEALAAKNPVSQEKSEENIEETDNHNG